MIKENIDRGAVKFAKNAGVLDRMEKNATSSCFITLKGHKQNFVNPTTRLINPAKNEIRRISKVTLDSINSKLQESLSVNQWKNSNSVIEWFKGIRNKSAYTFSVFDIKDFYPSITETLLKKSLDFARNHINISKESMIDKITKHFELNEKDIKTLSKENLVELAKSLEIVFYRGRFRMKPEDATKDNLINKILLL